MIEIASQIIINLLIATFIGFLMGFIVGRSTKSHIQEKKNLENQKNIHNLIHLKMKDKEGRPFFLVSPRYGKKDNLRKIKGIDKILEEDLNELGIFHFEQIAQWSDKNCEWIEDFLNLSGLTSELKWVEQAKILETGKETLFSVKIKN